MELHTGHKLIRTKDEESLNKENITIVTFTKDFNEINNNVNKLKDKIEKEIQEINKCYDIVDKQVKKKFEEEHNKLYIEENNLRDKFQTEVTKKKEYLENYLSETNELIKNYEKINKGIKILENEEKNMIKILAYVSNINKSIKQMNHLTNEFIKNLKISFEEEQRKIIYKEYIFNGLPVPKNIKCEDISSNNFKLKWEIDEDKINKLDNDKIKYKVEIKKKVENNDNKIKDEKFQKEFIFSDINCTINDLECDTEYEFKICCVYDDIAGEYSEIQKVKTLKLENNLFNLNNPFIPFHQNIYPNYPPQLPPQFIPQPQVYQIPRQFNDN